jgi:hypothetical protein
MAIFRQGKRIGPFDIRAGLSRGDLARSAYHKTDSDPRLKQPGTYSENTIGRFRALMGKSEGYARPARFAVRINLPSNLGVLAADRTNGTTAPGQSGGAEITNIQAVNMQQLSSQMGSQVNMNCDSISMPAHDLQSEEHIQHGIPSQIVTGHGFTGTIGASFYADKYLRERHFFESWQKMAVGMRDHRVGYLKDYAGTIDIYQLGSNDQDGDTTDVPTYAIRATECYPETVSAVEYNYGSANQIVKINVGFQYRQWYNLTTDSIGSVDFGASSQTVHEVKKGAPGLFGFLPPDLQRTGRDVVNSAKNQIPVGRIFKGKIFPPFTT